MRLSTRSVAATLAAALLVGMLPTAAAAQTPVARVVLYEVWEALELRGPSIDLNAPDPEKFRRRFAEAGLLGREPLPLNGNTPFAGANLVVAEATSNVNIKLGSQGFGTGPIRGEFQLLKHVPLSGSDLQNLSDFVVEHEGRLAGTLDLRPALNPVESARLPLAFVSGTWSLKGLGGGRQKTFFGVFLIPFRVNGGVFYLIPAPTTPAEMVLLQNLCPAGAIAVQGGDLCPVTSEETVVGFHLTKAVIVLVE